jgi:chromate transporter
MQVGAIAAGAAAGWLYYSRGRAGEITSLPVSETSSGDSGHRAAVVALSLFGLLLVITPLLARMSGNRSLQVFDSFYRSGAFVFGGGHVVLPLLRAEVVPAGWVTDDAFLAGYGAAQAVPGPLFSFAGYLGTVIYSGTRAWIGGVWCLFAIFLPAWLIIGGALPFWHQLRARVWTQAALRGANAAVVGLLLAALYSPVIAEGIHGYRDAIIAVIAFVLLQFAKVPAWVVVLLAAAAGMLV